MIVLKGLGSNRLITSGYGWKFKYAKAFPMLGIGGGGGGGHRPRELPWDHLGYQPTYNRPPGWVREGRRPRRVVPSAADFPFAATDQLPAPAAVPLPEPEDQVAAAAETVIESALPPTGTAKSGVVLAPAMIPGTADWSTGTRIAIVVSVVGLAGVVVGYLLGRPWQSVKVPECHCPEVPAAPVAPVSKKGKKRKQGKQGKLGKKPTRGRRLAVAAVKR